MAEPALRVATEIVRIAVADFDMSWTPAVEFALVKKGQNLTDLHNALSCCEATRSNILEAEGVFLEVVGVTTEDANLTIKVRVNPDRRCFCV